MLHMSGLCTTPLAVGLKNMRCLKSIKLWKCHGLTRIPDFSGSTSLRDLNLSVCNDLVEVHASVGILDKLVNLKLYDCGKLQMFQERINLKSLETLTINHCPLKFFPKIEGEMKTLKYLNLDGTSIEELPCSVGYLTGLTSLSLNFCIYLTILPCSIFYALQRLEDLSLVYCANLQGGSYHAAFSMPVLRFQTGSRTVRV